MRFHVTHLVTLFFAAGVAASDLLPTGCSSNGSPSSRGGGDAGPDAPADAPSLPPPPLDAGIAHPCSLPGSVQFTANGVVTVPGGQTSWPRLAFLHLPAGFCAHYYGNVGNARQLRFAPGGELFVASPTTASTGGGA